VSTIAISIFTNELYRTLLGHPQMEGLTQRQVIEGIVEHWDPTKVMRPEHARLAARIAVCQIGMRWHPTDRFSFPFERVTEMLRDISPELKGKEVTAYTMRGILAENNLPPRRD
jgi:hypothetical protein